MTRRKFLAVSLAVGGGVVAGSALAGPLADWLTAPYGLAAGGPDELPDAPPGPLSAGARDALLAAAQTVLGVAIEPARYADYFAWRAENLRGHRALYEDFAALLNREAQNRHGLPFAAAGAAQRRALLDGLVEERLPSNRLKRVRGAIDPSFKLARLADEHIIGRVFAIFAATDGWVLAGYDGWPNSPRCLERYIHPPARAGFGRATYHG